MRNNSGHRRAGSRLALAALAVAAAASGAPPAVESYLATRGLTSLEYESLAARLTSAPADERAALVARAAVLLAELLENEIDPVLEREWNERAKDLLRRAGGADVEALELQLLRASYQRAERTAERWRLRTASDAESAAALRTLMDTASRLERLARRADQRLTTLEKRLSAAVGDDRDELAARLNDLRSRRSQAFYLAGWCRLYESQMTGSDDAAAQALSHFAWILGSARKPEPDAASVTAENLRLDHVARAALGSAAAYAQLGRAGRARSWLARAESGAGAAVADTIAGWRLVVAAALEDWNALMDALDADPDPSSARLVAVAAIESLRGSPARPGSARAALEAALTTLIDQGDSASLVELSRRYGSLPLSGRGFLARYASGVGLYLDAESLMKSAGLPADSPLPPGLHQKNFATVVRALTSALESGDAQQFPSAAGECRAVLGASLYYASEGEPGALASARTNLLAAADSVPDPERRASALWLAVRAARLEAAALSGERAADTTRAADEITARFLREFPDHDLAGSLLYEMAMRDGLDPRRRAELLGRVPPGSSAYPAALDQAARALYQIYRAQGPAGRTPAALRYLDAAEPLLTDDLAAVQSGAEKTVAARALARGRRMLDALLTMDPPDAARAATVLGRLEPIARSGDADAALELAYRRAQIALVAGDDAAATDAIARVEALAGASEKASRYSEALHRYVFRRAVAEHQRARAARSSPATLAQAARRVALAGRAIVPSEMSDPAAVTVALYLAEALDDLALFGDDPDARAEALALRLKVLAVRPADAALLGLVADGAEHLGRDTVAQDAWNRRLALLPVGTDEWFETRYRQLRHLAQSDPAQARNVLRRQHRVLYPDYGPDPWGARIRAIDESLGEGP